MTTLRLGDPGALTTAIRDVVAERDIFGEALDALDRWAADCGIVEALEVDGVSFWYHRRLGYWWRLQELLVWSAVVDRMVGEAGGDGIHGIHVTEAAPVLLREAAALVAQRDGIGFEVAERVPTTKPAPDRSGLLDRLRDRRRRYELGRRSARMASRFESRAAERRRPLLVLTEHVRQRVDTPSGPRLVNAYLDPVVDRLAGGALDPVVLELDVAVSDDERWQELRHADQRRRLPGDLLLTKFGRPEDLRDATSRATALADRVAGSTLRLPCNGLDLGPAMRDEVVRSTRSALPARLRDLTRARRLLAALRPAGVLLANEYGRSEWIAAARLESVPIAALQHGIIHPWHPGYVHPVRPPELPMADRTYVFGTWEQRLLTTRSVYRPEELVVAGSPRIDLVAAERSPRARDQVRRELGIADGDRMVVLSTSFAPPEQRFFTIPALAAIVDRPLERVHLVIKLHPRESADEPYSAVIRSRAAAGGFAAPPISVMQRYDLYRLLAAADAHLGIHSTVLTEAVVAGTPNLLAGRHRSGDLLGYVDAGVALRVANGGELIDALDRFAAGGGPTLEARRAFIEDHFRPGVAADRIRDDLLAWLA